MSIPIGGQFTSIDASSLSPSPLEVVTVAVLSTVPQVAAVVGDVMWTCLLVPEARSPQSQVSTPLVIVQPASLFAGSIAQARPASVGSVSVTVTPCAVPAPLFVASIVKPMASP